MDIEEMAHWIFRQTPEAGRNNVISFDIQDIQEKNDDTEIDDTCQVEKDTNSLFDCLLVIFSIGIRVLFGSEFHIHTKEDLDKFKALEEAGHPQWLLLCSYFRNFFRVVPRIEWREDGFRLFFETSH